MTIATHWQPYPWQQPLWQQWQGLVTSGRIPHALLIHGAQGTGKAALAWLIAAQQLCEQAGALPCQQCSACQLMAAGSHPHVYDLGVFQEQKLTVEAIRDATTSLMHTPVLHGPKIVIMPQAEMMALAAANALLKTLEEPSGHSLLLLTTAWPARLLPTIRSRCQSMAQTVTLTPTLSAWLQAHFQLSEPEVQRRWFWLPGAPLHMDPTHVPEQTFTDFLALGQALSESTPQALWAIRSLTERQRLSTLISWWQRWLGLWVVPPSDDVLWPALHGRLHQGCPTSVAKRAVPMLNRLQHQARELAAGYQVNESLQFEALLYHWLASDVLETI